MSGKIDQLTTVGGFQYKVAAVIKELEGKGFEPLIVSALRTPQEQAKKVAMGYSKTLKSNHLPDATGRARAADIVDRRWGYDTKQHGIECHRFFLTMARCAVLHGLGWGGFFGLGVLEKARLRSFLTDQTRKFDADNWQARIGWDPSHLEMPKG